MCNLLNIVKPVIVNNYKISFDKKPTCVNFILITKT
ncbi:hypothetical protein Q361_11558 [Flavobacterium croceum DSM 17960]|uniref:Uncharacterized protein n=1 Tax=Flavobacterium croceum DSM 17960 TaxID=1121886 RepID=A0A2S4N5R5_9FLAO|nr:hypothetical protein Q361_11558 [Flavobacterium croceum DSM 17960]